MKRRKTKTFLACLLAGVMAAGTAMSAMGAVSYEAPSQGMTANDNYIKGAAYAASSATLDILGVELVSSDNGGTGSSALGIFGSDINDNPDAYLYNFNYNSSTSGGGGNYSYDSYSSWTATPYTLYWSSNKQGPQGQASGSVEITIDGVTKTCNPAFYYEPDILIGNESGFSEQLSAYQTTYNADYDPTMIALVYDSNERSDGLGLEYNMFAMSAGVVDIGAAIDEIAEETGKTTRYEESAYEIATNYDKYNRGLYYYAQSAFESGELTPIRYVTGLAYDADTELWTISQETGRSAQYAAGIADDIFEVMGESYTFSDGSVVTPSVVTVSSSGPGGTTVTSEEEAYVLTTDQLIDVLTVTDEDGNSYRGVVIGSAGSDAVYTTLEDAGVEFLSNLPECIYGLNANATENGMGLAFYMSYFYYDQNEDLNPVSVIGYWIENFYHVSDDDAMQTVITNMLSSSDLNSTYTGAEELDINEYDEESIEALMVEGMEYYLDVVEPALDEAGTDSTSALYWTTLDTTVGVGADEFYCDNYGHEYEAEVTEPTCTEKGYTTYTCVHCGDSYETDYTDAAGHTYVESVTEPTETSQGYTTYTCSVCGDSYTANFTDALGSTAVKQTITVKKTVSKTVKAKKLKKKKQTFKIKATTSGDGKITFTKKSGSKKLTISKAGKVTVKKGTYKKGKTLKMKVNVKAAKTASCKAAAKTITVKVKIK